MTMVSDDFKESVDSAVAGSSTQKESEGMEAGSQEKFEDATAKELFVPGRFNPLSDEITEYILKSVSGLSDSCGDFGTCRKDDPYLQRLEKSLSILSLPPRFTTVRVNLQKMSVEDGVTSIKSYLNKQYQSTLENKSDLVVSVHTVIPDLIYLYIESQGSKRVIPVSKEIVVGQLCGAAVLRGADVYAPGVLGVTPNIQYGDEVSVYADLDNNCLRGTKLYKGKKMFVGNGIAVQGRTELFRIPKPSGVAVTMKEKVFDCPSIGDLCKDVFFLQNLPSVLCSHVLKPARSGVVLDMCAAPGGKATHLSSLVGDEGIVIAIDKSQRKTDQIKENAKKLGLTNILAYSFDSTKLVGEDHASDTKNIKLIHNLCDNHGESDTGKTNLSPPFLPSSFKWILLDAPCSALGQRPQIVNKNTLKELNSYPVIQRKLLKSAIMLLQSKGELVYSTCTIAVEENEKMVKWVLDNFKCMELVDSTPKIGLPGLSNCGLDYDQCKKVQRFGPVIADKDVCNVTVSEVDCDTIGFFIAKFKKNVNVAS